LLGSPLAGSTLIVAYVNRKTALMTLVKRRANRNDDQV
jgi:hypothetical protein